MDLDGLVSGQILGKYVFPDRIPSVLYMLIISSNNQCANYIFMPSTLNACGCFSGFSFHVYVYVVVITGRQPIGRQWDTQK